MTILSEWQSFYVIFGSVAGALVASALVALSEPRASLFCVAAAILLLLLIGIHNAWDSDTYHVLVKQPEQGDH